MITRHTTLLLLERKHQNQSTFERKLTSSKQKPVQATKGTRIKSKAKVAKSDKKKQPAKKPKAKGLAVLSEVALTEAEQLKLATKRSKIQFHSSHASGSDKGTGTIPGVPDVPIYEYESKKESWGNSEDEDEDNENDSDNISDEGDNDNDGNNGNDGDDDDANDDDKQKGDDTNDDDEETDNEDFTKELYDDVNVNLGNEDTKMTNADQGASEQQNFSQESRFEQVEKDAHVTLYLVLDTQKADEPVQSSSVSSDFTSKLLNLENPSPADNEITSLMETSACHATTVPKNTSGFTITIPPPLCSSILFYNKQHRLQHQQLLKLQPHFLHFQIYHPYSDSTTESPTWKKICQR
ncbi:hypothetical protein Tco_1144927 [Tanacetum coccineum]